MDKIGIRSSRILPEFDREDLVSLQEKAQKLSTEELDRNLSESACEVVFLVSQLESDLGSYHSEEIERAHEKISHYKQKVEILKIEMAQRRERE